MQKFRVSAVGPFLTTRAFYPQLKSSANPFVINISSNVGSISGNCITRLPARNASADEGYKVMRRVKTSATGPPERLST